MTIRFNSHEANSDTRTVPQLDDVCMDAAERDKNQAYLKRIQGTVDLPWSVFSGRG